MQNRNDDSLWPASAAPLNAAMDFDVEGLVLGEGTVLAPATGDRTIRLQGKETRLLTLLSVAYGRPVGQEVLGHVRKGVQRWREGEDGLARLHLSLTRLGPMADARRSAQRLRRADGLLAAGVEPRTVLKAIDIDASILEPLFKYDASEDRVPAGEGRGGGEWTDGSGDVGGSGPDARKRLMSAQDVALANPRFAPTRDGTTYCNQATVSVLKTAGASLAGFVDKAGRPVSANQMARNLIAMAKSGEVREISQAEAQTEADQGHSVVAAYFNPNGHGHVATVRPKEEGAPSAAGRGPLLANVGRDVGVMRYSRVFRASAKVGFYVIR